MTPEERKTICLHRFEVAHETWNEAQELLEKRMLRGSVNRIYYAMFYAASGLALAEGFTTSKHTGLQSWINKNVIHQGRISQELGNAYNFAFETRSKGDYTDWPKLDFHDIAKLHQNAQDFIETLYRLTLKQMDFKT